MKNVLLTSLLAIGAVAGSVPALASDTSARNYGRQDSMRTQNVTTGRVLMVREVTIKNRSRANTGTAIGGAVGVAAAQGVKSSDARKVMRIVGGTGGALAGGAIHNAVTARRGVEIVVETFDSRGRSQVVSIVQDNDQVIRSGDQVLLIGRGSQQRVVVMEQSVQPARQTSIRNTDPCQKYGSYFVTMASGECGVAFGHNPEDVLPSAFPTALGIRSH